MDTRYSLNELAEMTQLEPRTIRWYISEGLLRGPESMGRNAYYTDHHRKRLETIRTLKEVYHLPLKEIRRYILMAGDEDIQIVPVDQESWPSLPSSPMVFEQTARPDQPGRHLPSRLRSRAMRIRAQRMEELSLRAPDACYEEAGSFGLGVPVPSNEPLDKVLDALRGLLGERRVARQASAEERFLIPITPELGLYLNGPFSPEQVARFEMLADHLRELLLGGVGEGADRIEDEGSES